MKTLFLDFDGVLHQMSQMNSKPFNRLPLLEPLADEHHFQIVISSSWRFHFELSQISPRLGRLAPLVVGTTGEAMIGRNARYREILEYVDHHQITDWRALDDSFLEFPDGTSELILCNPRVGVSSSEIYLLRQWLLIEKC